MAGIDSETSRTEPRTWVLALGIVFGGGILTGGSLLIVAAVRAADYSGFGDSSGVYRLLTWAIPIAGVSVAALIVLVASRLVVRRIRTLPSSW